MSMGSGFGRGMRSMYHHEDVEEKPQINRQVAGRILRYFRPYWKLQLLVVVLVSLMSGLGLIPALLIRQIIDIALPEGDMRYLIILTSASLLTTLLLGLISVGESYLNNWIGKHIVFDLRNSMYNHLQKMGLRFFSETRTGDIISRINNDVSGVERVITGTIVQALQSVMTVSFTLIAIFAMDWRLSVLGICLIPSFILPTRRVGRARWSIAKKTQEKLAELNQIIQETLGIAGSVLVKIFTAERREQDRFYKVSKEVISLQIKESLVGRWFRMFIGVFASLGPALIYFYGGYLVIQGELTTGVIVAFIALLNRLYGPTAQLFNLHIDIVRSFALFERVFEYLDMEPDVQEKNSPIALPVAKGRIEFSNVHFAYKKGNPVLQDINFTVEPGQLVALVGPSGAGKSTTTYLVPRLYDPDEGLVTLDGHDLRDLSIESLRRQVGIVTQDTFLFNATIRENVLYGRFDASESQIMDACQAAYIHDLIMSLPDQYDTVVGERGIKLSGGEKQRVAIARAILKDPQIMILDEATSSLDSHAETLIQSALEPLLANRTSLVIAHRLSTIHAADKILVFDAGQIVEAGSHNELLRYGGVYNMLYEEQFKLKNS